MPGRRTLPATSTTTSPAGAGEAEGAAAPVVGVTRASLAGTTSGAAASREAETGTTISTSRDCRTHQALADAAVRERVRGLGSPLAAFVDDVLKFFTTAYARQGFSAPAVHDLCAVAAVLDPGVMTYRDAFVTDTFGSAQRPAAEAGWVPGSQRPVRKWSRTTTRTSDDESWALVREGLARSQSAPKRSRV